MNLDIAESQVLRRPDVTLEEADSLRRENEVLRDRLSRLSKASLRITEYLDHDAVLQGVIDGACSLTRARYGALVGFDDSGGIEGPSLPPASPPKSARDSGTCPRAWGSSST